MKQIQRQSDESKMKSTVNRGHLGALEKQIAWLAKQSRDTSENSFLEAAAEVS
jgi:hypothetical protein